MKISAQEKRTAALFQFLSWGLPVMMWMSSTGLRVGMKQGGNGSEN